MDDNVLDNLSRPSLRHLGRGVATADDGRMRVIAPLLVAAAAFAVYWVSAGILDARAATAMFGADSDQYSVMDHGWVNHRAARFHPLTIVLALGWMKVFAPLAAWLFPSTILNAFFAAAGATGVWAATVTFQALLPRREALLAGLVYAASLGTWYFSAIPESKIVTATLSVLYIAAYVRLRERWTDRGAAVLSIVLAAACLNEIVSAFLVAIPVVDTVLRRGFDHREARWLAPHLLIVFAAWLVLEVFVNGWWIPESAHREGQSHVNMLLYYIAKNDYGFASFYSFLLNWFLFNMAAPTSTAPLWPQQGGYFAPEFSPYFLSLPGLGILAALAAIGVAATCWRDRDSRLGSMVPLLAALAAYALVRAAFFFVFNPAEPILFSPAVTLAHWLILLVPFAASRFPAKSILLAVLAVCLFAANAGLILGRPILAFGG